MRNLFFLYLIFISFSTVAHSISCLNEKGASVDWWIMLKFPTSPTTSNPALATGYAYAFGDSTTNTLQISSKQLNIDEGALGLTISQIYTSSSSTTGSAMYDDETPDGSEHSSYGHTKGVLGFDSKTGFWLIHSVPRFPNATAPYQFPANEKTYGQSFLCVTYDTATFNTIGSLFQINKPYFYLKNIPSSLESTLPNLSAAFSGKWITTATTKVVDLKSYPNSHAFTVFAKNSQWNNELYEYLVEPHYNDAGQWETWMNGVNPLPTYCTPTYKYDCINIRSVNIFNQASWTETKDHSKWGVLFNHSVVCIGDINRQNGQLSRGGGTACFTNTKVWQIFTGLVASADTCPK